MPVNYDYIYVHIPFCEVICHYCDFYTARTKDADYDLFFRALEQEIITNLPSFSRKISAVYMGGGTPGASPPHLLKSMLALFKSRLSPDAEITIETNPKDITEDNLLAWREAGINRVSLGVQSLQDPILKKIGRAHSASDALRAISLLSANFARVSCDLIYGIPDQSPTAPLEDAIKIADLGVKHISAYHLTLPTEHFLYPKLPAGEAALQQIRLLHDRLAERSFNHYEVSNFGHPGHESQNNLNYWRGHPYFALGPSAHGFDGANFRWKNISNWKEYARRVLSGESPIEERETLSAEQRKIEVLFTRLRTAEGLNLDDYFHRFGSRLEDIHRSEINSLIEKGLATLAKGNFALTFDGRMLADEITQRLLRA